MPEGLLVLRGEDYTLSSDLAQQGLGAIHKHIRDKLQTHYAKCNGNAVVVFDEVQKVVPGALEAISQLLGERGSINIPIESSSYYCVLGCSRTIEVSTASSIFIFISDIALDTMIKMLLAYDQRRLIPMPMLRSVVKEALDSQWDRLQFGKYIKEVVPFLPLEKEHMMQVFRLKVQSIGLEHRYRYWWNLVVDTTVLEYLSGPLFIKYTQHSTVVVRRGEDDGDETRTKIFSTYGARGIENAGPLQDLKAKIYSKMQPWQPQKLLHVGLTSVEIVEQLKGQYMSKKSFLPELYMQWCVPDGNMFDENSSVVSINEEMALGAACSTVWIGMLSSS